MVAFIIYAVQTFKQFKATLNKFKQFILIYSNFINFGVIEHKLSKNDSADKVLFGEDMWISEPQGPAKSTCQD